VVVTEYDSVRSVVVRVVEVVKAVLDEVMVPVVKESNVITGSVSVNVVDVV